jgi:hypothetical protein
MNRSSRNAENVFLINADVENLENRYTFSSNSLERVEMDNNSDRILSSLSRLENTNPPEILSSENTKIYEDKLCPDVENKHIYIIDYAESAKNKEEVIKVDNMVNNFSIESNCKSDEMDVVKLKKNLDGDVKELEENNSIKDNRRSSAESLSIKSKSILMNMNELIDAGEYNLREKSIKSQSIKENKISEKLESMRNSIKEIPQMKDANIKIQENIKYPDSYYINISKDEEIAKKSISQKEELPKVNIQKANEDIYNLNIQSQSINNHMPDKDHDQEDLKHDNIDFKEPTIDKFDHKAENLKQEVTTNQDYINYWNSAINNRYLNVNVEDINIKKTIEGVHHSSERRKTYNIGRLKITTPIEFSDDLSFAGKALKNVIYTSYDFSKEIFTMLSNKIHPLYKELIIYLKKKSAISRITAILHHKISNYTPLLITILIENKKEKYTSLKERHYILKKSFLNFTQTMKNNIKLKKIYAYNLLRAEQYKRYLKYKFKAKIFSELKSYCYFRKKWIDEIQKEIKKNTIM